MIISDSCGWTLVIFAAAWTVVHESHPTRPTPLWWRVVVLGATVAFRWPAAVTPYDINPTESQLLRKTTPGWVAEMVELTAAVAFGLSRDADYQYLSAELVGLAILTSGIVLDTCSRRKYRRISMASAGDGTDARRSAIRETAVGTPATHS